MLKKIAVADVRPGMYVVDMGLSWLENPYLYTQEGLLQSERDIAGIRAEGYLEVFIDTRRSLIEEDTAGLTDEELISGEVQRTLAAEEALAPLIPLSEEMGEAREVYAQSVSFARDAMESMRKSGVVDVAASEPLVEDVLASVTRNANALVGLTKLRASDEYTYAHCINVSVLSVVFGRHLGFGELTLRRLGMAGLFHDLGKSLVPEGILNSPRKLSPQEFDVMRQHPQLGYDQVCNANNIPEEVCLGMLEHHEKYNGLGYPRGLAGENISVIGRILAVADVYDALTSRRVYKEAMLPHKALGLMYGMRGQDFFPGMVERFIRCIGIYPVGSVVELNTGHRAVVAEVSLREPLQPRVLVVRDPRGRPCASRSLSLAGQTAVRIAACLDPREAGIDPAAALGVTG